VRQLAEAARAKRKAALQHRQTNLETTEAEARVVQQRAAEMRSAADRIMQVRSAECWSIAAMLIFAMAHRRLRATQVVN
jgi:hypothetical protein